MLFKKSNRMNKSSGPLTGVVVIDLTRILSGPFATRLLYNLGATIIKIEPPGGDDTRYSSPRINEQSAYFMALNHGKKSICLNLKDDVDRRTFAKLLAKADVLVENFRVGVMDKLGYSWEYLHTNYPRLILASISGAGQNGPIYANGGTDHYGYDLIAQGMTGLMSIVGEKNNTAPLKAGIEIGDTVSGVYLANGISAALYAREKTGLGDRIEVSLLETIMSIMTSYMVKQSYSPEHDLQPSGNRHPLYAPFDSYTAKDGVLIICTTNDRCYFKLVAAIKDQRLNNDKFANNNSRLANVEELTILLNDIFAAERVDYWIECLAKYDVPCGKVHSVNEMLGNEQLIQRNMIRQFANPDYMPQIKFPGNPCKIDSMADLPRVERGPLLDEQREEILDFANF